MLPDFVLSYLKFNYFPEEWDQKRKESVAKPAGHQPEPVPTGIHQPGHLPARRAIKIPIQTVPCAESPPRRAGRVSTMSGFDFTTVRFPVARPPVCSEI